MFKVSDPSEARGNGITAREILDRASNQIDPDLANDPETQARLTDAMGTSNAIFTYYGDTSLSCHWQFCLYADPAALLARARALKTSDLNPSGLVRG